MLIGMCRILWGFFANVSDKNRKPTPVNARITASWLRGGGMNDEGKPHYGDSRCFAVFVNRSARWQIQGEMSLRNMIRTRKLEEGGHGAWRQRVERDICLHEGYGMS